MGKVFVKDIVNVMNLWANPCDACEWDNPGLQVGHMDQEVHHVLTALDATEAVIHEAIQLKADMIVTHHPLIFKPIQNVTDMTRNGRRILSLAENGIALFCAHTNMDKADNGTNAILTEWMMLQNVQNLDHDDVILRLGMLPQPMTVRDLALKLKTLLSAESVRLVSQNPDESVQTVAVCSGGGAKEAEEAFLQGASVFITGDVVYHQAELVYSMGKHLIDAGHFSTEVPIAHKIQNVLHDNFPDLSVEVSKAMQDPFMTL